MVYYIYNSTYYNIERLICLKKIDRFRLQNAILIVTCVVYTVLLLQALFFKLVSSGELFDIGGRVRAFNFIPFGGSEYLYAIKKDVIINTMLFAPLGFMLAMRSKGRRRRPLLLLAAFAISVCAEALQYLLAVGVADITDVICNTVGAALGFALYDVSSKIAKGSEKLDRIYYAAMFCVCCIVLICFIAGNWYRIIAYRH